MQTVAEWQPEIGLRPTRATGFADALCLAPANSGECRPRQAQPALRNYIMRSASNRSRLDRLVRLASQNGDKVAEAREARVARVAADVAGVDLLHDHGDFEQAEAVEKEGIGNEAASLLFVARHQLAAREAAGDGGRTE